MARVKGGGSEVILICAADYFTGAVLLNRLVCPVEDVVDWRTQIHGITPSTIQTAILEGQALAGWKQAREELWKCVDKDTILVGHALHHDLEVLRMIHSRVVDSAILARNAMGPGYPQSGLKMLCEELLNIEIRKNEKEVHDCLEDVLATRELVLWCTRNQQKLRDWATAKRQEEEWKKEERKKAQREKARMIANAERRKARDPKFEANYSNSGSSYDEDEVLHWSDIAEDCGFPHPDTGYDPWSD
jgi:DNA polymerase III epsilon subunit-like protein